MIELMFTVSIPYSILISMRKRSDVIRNAILETAKSLFVVNGYDFTTIDQIAKNAGVSKRTLYAYYPNKNAILKCAIADSVSSSLEPDSNKNISIESRDDMFRELYKIAKSLNNIFAKDSYAQLLRVVISEINHHSELKNISGVGIVSHSVGKLASMFESTNASGLTSITNINDATRMFIGGFLVQFFVDRLLEPIPNKYVKYNSTELFNYVDSFTKVIFSLEPSLNDNILVSRIKATGKRYINGI